MGEWKVGMQRYYKVWFMEGVGEFMMKSDSSFLHVIYILNNKFQSIAESLKKEAKKRKEFFRVKDSDITKFMEKLL